MLLLRSLGLRPRENCDYANSMVQIGIAVSLNDANAMEFRTKEKGIYYYY